MCDLTKELKRELISIHLKMEGINAKNVTSLKTIGLVVFESYLTIKMEMEAIQESYEMEVYSDIVKLEEKTFLILL